MHLYAPGVGGPELALVFPALVILRGTPALTINPTQSVSAGPDSASASDPNNVVPAGIWSAFTNNGPCLGCVHMPVDGVPFYALAYSGGALDAAVTGSWSASATVVYTYDEPGVPEPAMLTLVGGGLLGLGFFSRRRKKA